MEKIVPLALPPDSILFGRTAAMRGIRQKLEQITEINHPVLLVGEHGTGKELIAQIIHNRSASLGGMFLKVDCRANGESALDRVVYACEEDASRELAAPIRRGTLFLDEIADMSPALQEQLLDILQRSQACHDELAGAATFGPRIVCSSSRNLRAQVESGAFLADLFDCLEPVTLRLPPLRERKDDIPSLVSYFSIVYGEKFGRQPSLISMEGMRRMQNHRWPGNIRELENQVIRHFFPEHVAPLRRAA